MQFSTIATQNLINRANMDSARARFAIGETVTTIHGIGKVSDILFDHDINSAVICVELPSARFDWTIMHRIPV